VSISGPNFNPNQASIFNSVNRNSANFRSDKLKLKDNRVNGEIVDVDYRSVGSDDKDSFNSNNSNHRMAYKNSIYARVLEDSDNIELNKKNNSEANNNNETFLNETWQASTKESPRERIEREVDQEITKKLEEINDRLSRIESKLGIHEPDSDQSISKNTGYKINPDFNSSYTKHNRDYSSMIPGLEMHNLKRKWNA